MIGYVAFECPPRLRTIEYMTSLLLKCQIRGNAEKENELDLIMKPAQSILINAYSKLVALDFPELNIMTATDDMQLARIGQEKTAVFVVVSDTDRSMDSISNLFFDQVLQELCGYADNECPDGRLPVGVRFILDDFATNVKIDEFPRIVSCICSRNISAMIMIQTETQLKAAYGEDGQTINWKNTGTSFWQRKRKKT